MHVMLPTRLRRLVGESFRILGRVARLPVWVVAFSGGKDSSVLLDLVIRFLEPGDHSVDTLVVVYSDTLLDPFPIRSYALTVLERLSRIQLNGVDIYALASNPLQTGEDLVEMVIVRGYPAPSTRFRWCTDRWKIRPASTLFRKRVGARPRNQVAVITGVRAEEATHRARRAQAQRQPACMCPVALNESFGGTPVTPIISWTSRDVWSYISSLEPYWGMPSWKTLVEIYGRRESLRTGCWVCTLISRDEGWESLASRNLVDTGLYRLMKKWRRLWLHMSREKPEYWRQPKTVLRTRSGREWKYRYGKLTIEARMALALCLQKIFEHPAYPRDAAAPLLAKLYKVLGGFDNTVAENLCRTLSRDSTAARILGGCMVSLPCPSLMQGS